LLYYVAGEIMTCRTRGSCNEWRMSSVCCFHKHQFIPHFLFMSQKKKATIFSLSYDVLVMCHIQSTDCQDKFLKKY